MSILKEYQVKKIEVSIDNQLFWGVAVGANGNSPSKNKAFQTASNYYLYPCKQALYENKQLIIKPYTCIDKNNRNLLL